jgi:hypothetical protein
VDTGGFSYTIAPVVLPGGINTTKVVWGEALEGSSRDILAEVEGEEIPQKRESKLGDAERFLMETLAHGPVSANELKENAREQHSISSITLRRAKDKLGIKARKDSNGKWLWHPTTEIMVNRSSFIPSVPPIPQTLLI